MSSQMRTSQSTPPVTQEWLGGELDKYLDAVVQAQAILRSAVEAYVRRGPEGACWQQAKRISEHMSKLDGLQRRLQGRAQGLRREDGLVGQIVDPLGGFGRLLRDIKRQITGYAIESGFFGPDRRVPEGLVEEVLRLTEEVCAAVVALVRTFRLCLSAGEGDLMFRCERSVAWHEREADRRSMLLLKQIFGDQGLDLEAKLLLARFVEEIDRVADYAEDLDRGLRVRCDSGARLRAVDLHGTYVTP